MLKVLILSFMLCLSVAAAQHISDENVGFEIENLNEISLEQPTYRFPPVTIQQKLYSIISFSKVNWFMAQQICSYRGMTLASLNSEAEAKEVQRILTQRGLTSETFWLSGTNLSDRNHWVWFSNGLYLPYSNWEKGHPNINLRCMRLLPEGKWDSFNCEGQHFFICENRCPLSGYSTATPRPN